MTFREFSTGCLGHFIIGIAAAALVPGRENMPVLTPRLSVLVAVSQPFNQRLKGEEIARRPGDFHKGSALWAGIACGMRIR
jgi:hypothetical protein